MISMISKVFGNSERLFSKLNQTFQNVSRKLPLKQKHRATFSPNVLGASMVPHPFVITNIHTVNESSSGGKPYIGGSI